MLYPLTFHPIFKERIWGGRKLEEFYGKPLPAGAVVGESWEISDRPGDVSVIANGPLGGKDLHELVERFQIDLLGSVRPGNGRFPFLVKILDACQTLSLQVHPPAGKAAALGGEPKTEMWYITQAEPGSRLYAGLKRGVTRADFEARLAQGTVEECFHQVPVTGGDAMFLPSGRVHALGAGLVLFEIQQNSDTTYRVFDWNRPGLDGKPRQLHVEQSLACIDFDDFEPAAIPAASLEPGQGLRRTLVRDPLFQVEEIDVRDGGVIRVEAGEMRIIGLVSGEAEISGEGVSVILRAGQFCLLPASISAEVRARSAFRALVVGQSEK